MIGNTVQLFSFPIPGHFCNVYNHWMVLNVVITYSNLWIPFCIIYVDIDFQELYFLVFLYDRPQISDKFWLRDKSLIEMSWYCHLWLVYYAQKKSYQFQWHQQLPYHRVRSELQWQKLSGRNSKALLDESMILPQAETGLYCV